MVQQDNLNFLLPFPSPFRSASLSPAHEYIARVRVAVNVASLEYHLAVHLTQFVGDLAGFQVAEKWLSRYCTNIKRQA